MFLKISKPKKNIYLDHAAATPLDLRVKKVMTPFLNENFGNPSSLHQKGREAKAGLEQSRKMIADIIGASPSEVIFTAGGSESVNLAIFGVAGNIKNNQAHFITSSIEHHCVLNSFQALAGEGRQVSYIKVDGQGIINLEELKSAVRPETILISVMLANNEVGSLQPIAEIGKWLKGENAKRAAKKNPAILLHTDACQAAGYLDINVNRLGVDLMSVNGSKIYGPKQTGFLYVRSGIKLKPLVYGGGQERSLRSGTENVAGVVGLSRALELAQKEMAKENKRLKALRDYFINKVVKKDILLNGAYSKQLKVDNRLPNNINLTVKGVEGETLMLYLDSYGISVSTSSACSTGSAEASHVLLAMGRNEKEAKSSIRLTLGKYTTKADLDYVLKVLNGLIPELRSVKALN
ncbi:MAG: cysteine desulfurase [Candidatus Doudnabacteria bacterium]|nr:cysteine desulfurase [Candidatus Doudnabacteria bacterium]